jgi:UDP-Gal:alpha-D-GlcNAc-diphosphoundecaprenol beta-1,4-galactosyltransferase
MNNASNRYALYDSIFKKINRTSFEYDIQIKSDKMKLISFLNPSSFLQMKMDQLAVLTDLYVDGRFLVFVLRYFFKIKIRAASADYSSIIGVFFDHCIKSRYSIALIGGSESECKKAADTIKKKHSDLKIKVIRNGFFESDYELDCFVENLDVDVALVGMGAPRQELFLKRCSELNANLKIGMTCGGFLTQTAKRDHFYHPIVLKLGLRWLQRSFEYKHVRKRLLRDYPYFLTEMIKFRFQKNHKI